MSMFVDDTTLSETINSNKKCDSVYNMLCDDIRKVEDWADKWLVCFNAKKTQQITISRKAMKDTNNVKFLGETLKDEDSIKLLGVNITNTLDWNYHVNKIASNSGRL